MFSPQSRQRKHGDSDSEEDEQEVGQKEECQGRFWDTRDKDFVAELGFGGRPGCEGTGCNRKGDSAVRVGDSIREALSRVVVGGDAGSLLEHAVTYGGELLGSLDDGRGGAVAGLTEESSDGAVDDRVLDVVDGDVAEESEHHGAMGGRLQFRVLCTWPVHGTADSSFSAAATLK